MWPDIKTAYNDVRILSKSVPCFFYPIAVARSRRGKRAVSRATDVVIEGFPRSANTFAVEAFRIAQPEPVNLAHHFHAASQILLAHRWGVPAIVLIRPPREAVASRLVFDESSSAEECLREYLLFYSRLESIADHIVVASFDEIVTDFGGAIRRVNAKYGRSFRPYVPNRENDAAVRLRVAAAGNRAGQGLRQVALPHAGRELLTRAALRRIDSPRVAPLLARATELWQRFPAGGDATDNGLMVTRRDGSRRH